MDPTQLIFHKHLVLQVKHPNTVRGPDEQPFIIAKTHHDAIAYRQSRAELVLIWYNHD
jgi:hypothetical protein